MNDGVLSRDLLAPQDWTFPVPIRYGPGRLREIGDVCRRLGMRRPLLVTDRGSAALPFLAAAYSHLGAAGIETAIFANISPNPTDRDVAAGCEAFHAGEHDSIVAIGGGSGMDAGKAISLVARSDASLAAFDYDAVSAPAIPDEGFVPLVTVPTTAGTGAETDSTAMVTDTRHDVKICVWHACHKPATALLDPELTVGLPPDLTAWTGLDALVHAIEAYSVPTWHPPCDGLALEAMRLIASALPRAVDNGANVEARAAMLVGSCLAGMSFTKGLGLVHAISHMVGAEYDTHHGLTNAVVLPAVLRYNRAAVGVKADIMATVLDVPGASFDALYAYVERLLDAFEIPPGLGALGVSASRAAQLAGKAHGDAARTTNPAPASVAQIEALLREAIISAR